jgi:hypothetical protein
MMDKIEQISSSFPSQGESALVIAESDEDMRLTEDGNCEDQPVVSEPMNVE